MILCLENDNVDRDHLEILLTDFGVKFSKKDSDEMLKSKLKKFVLTLAMSWDPELEHNFFIPLLGGIASANISDYIVHKIYNRFGPLTMLQTLKGIFPSLTTYWTPASMHALAFMSFLLGRKAILKALQANSEVRLDKEEIKEVLNRNSIEEWFEQKPDADIYEKLVRKCKMPGACNESDNTCQLDKDNNCRPNTRLQILYRPARK